MSERLRTTLKEIEQLSVDEGWLSHPGHYTWLPYPSLNSPRNGRLTVQFKEDKDGYMFVFPYMGRAPFADIHNHYQRYVHGKKSARRLIVQGTIGSGKASCLAAMACLLIHRGHHVIFVLNCYALKNGFLPVMRDVLRSALPSEQHSSIDAAKSPESLLKLLSKFPKDYFIFILVDWDAYYP